jgi:radical SAM superfamily enzyme YgiQ (UPF0313 family)
MARVIFIDLLADIYDLHGVYALMAYMKQEGIEVHFARSRDLKVLLAKIAEVKPDLVLYSSLSSDLPQYAAFDKIAKARFGLMSVIGGPGATFDPQWINTTTIDAACVGEGELALVDFIRSGYKGSRNIMMRGGVPPAQLHPLVDLDKLPFPDRDIVYAQDPLLANMPSKQFISGRGCPYQCTHCFNHKFNRMFEGCGPIVRKKSVDRLLNEIRGVMQKYPLKNIVFNDDTFIIDKKWFFEFAERFHREIGLPYTCNVRANLVDAAIVKVLKENGCVAVNWSIESGNDFFRNEVLKRGMSREQILEASRLLTEAKIPYRIGNVIGLPGEKAEQMMETVEINIEAKPVLATAAIFTPFPGLAVTRYAIDHGYYVPEESGGLPKNFFSRSILKMSDAEHLFVRKLIYLFPLFVRFPWLFHHSGRRAFMLSLPVGVLRVIFHLFQAVKMMKMYRVGSSLWHRFRLAVRHLAMLFT